jgi:hypothetical protein
LRRSYSLLGAGGTYAYLNREIPVPDAIRFEIGLPGSGGLGGAAVSPDGRMLAFVARNAEGQTKLWVRSLSTSEAHPLDGTEGVLGLPFWSWDSRYIAFGTDGKLKKIEAAGSPAQTLCAVSATVAGGIWTSDGKIVFGQSNPAPTNQVSASGGTATAVPHESVVLATPSLLPDGKHFFRLEAEMASILHLSKTAARKCRAAFSTTIPQSRTLLHPTRRMGMSCLCGEPPIQG